MKHKFLNHIKNRMYDDKGTGIVMLIYTALCLVSAVWWMVDFSLRNMLVSFLFIGFVFFIFWVEYFLHIRFATLFVIASLTLAFGGILGACFDFYMLLPSFDEFLHGLSGVLFAGLGFAVGERFFGGAKNKKSFFGCLVFALCFSLAIAVVWEIFEYMGTYFFKGDNEEDMIVYDIYSYYLAGGHNELVIIEDIEKTLIYYGDGLVYEIEGYLDLGVIDTVMDMVVCAFGALIFFVTAVFSYKVCPVINKILIPRAVEEPKAEEAADDIFSEEPLPIEQ